MISKLELKLWALKHGFQPKGPFFYRLRDKDNTMFRLKPLNGTVLYEKETSQCLTDQNGAFIWSKQWVRLGFAYYKDIEITDNDILIGFKRTHNTKTLEV